MEDNTVIVPPFIELSSTSPGDIESMPHNSRTDSYRSDINSVDRFLFNKKCNVNYQHDASTSSSETSNASLKRAFNLAFDPKLNYLHNSDDFSKSKRRSRERDSSSTAPVTEEALTELISSGDQATMDKIVYLATVNAKKIMSLLNNSKSIKQFQTRLQPLMLSMCVDMYRDRPKNDENVTSLKNRVNSLNEEKTMLCNIIKSQYESIKKLKDQEDVLSKSEQEKAQLKSELGNLKRLINEAFYKWNIKGHNDMFTSFINRRPPDVY